MNKEEHYSSVSLLKQLSARTGFKGILLVRALAICLSLIDKANPIPVK